VSRRGCQCSTCFCVLMQVRAAVVVALAVSAGRRPAQPGRRAFGPGAFGPGAIPQDAIPQDGDPTLPPPDGSPNPPLGSGPTSHRRRPDTDLWAFRGLKERARADAKARGWASSRARDCSICTGRSCDKSRWRHCDRFRGHPRLADAPRTGRLTRHDLNRRPPHPPRPPQPAATTSADGRRNRHDLRKRPPARATTSAASRRNPRKRPPQPPRPPQAAAGRAATSAGGRRTGYDLSGWPGPCGPAGPRGTCADPASD
jgi:hypothetical protein